MRFSKASILALISCMVTFVLVSAFPTSSNLQSSCHWTVTCDSDAPGDGPLEGHDAGVAIHDVCQYTYQEHCVPGKGPMHPGQNITGDGLQEASAKVRLGQDCGGLEHFTVHDCEILFGPINAKCGNGTAGTVGRGWASADCDGSFLWIDRNYRCAAGYPDPNCRDR